MGKLLKFFAWTLGSLALLALVSFAALKLYFTPERIKTLITSYAQANLKRQISLDSASLNLRGFSLKNLRISEYPDFAKGEFFSAEEFSIRPNFRALLKKRLKIDSVSASGLKMTVLEVKKDSYNFDDLVASTETAPGAGKPAAGTAAKPAAFGISHIAVKNSRLAYTSADKTLGVVLDGIQLEASSISGEGLFPFEADFTLRLKSRYLNGDFPAYVKGKADLGALDLKKGKAKIEKALLNAGNINCELSGALENFLEPDAQLDLRVKPFASGDLKTYFASVPNRILLPAVDAAADFKLTPGRLAFRKLDFKAGQVEGSVKGGVSWDPAFSYNLVAKVKAKVPEMNSDLLAAKFPAVPRGYHIPFTELEAEASLRPGKAKLKRAKLTAASVSAELSGDFSSEPRSASGALKFSAGNARDLAAVYPPLKQYEPSGGAGGELSFSYDKALELRGAAELNGLGARFAGRQLSELKGTVEISKDAVSAASLTGKLDGANLRAEFSAKNYSSHPQVMLNLDLAALRLAALPQGGGEKGNGAAKKKAAAKPFAFDLSGKARLGSVSHPNLTAGETVINYDLKDISEDMKRLSGQASFDVKGGKFDKLYDLARESKAAKVALYPMLILGKASKAVKGFKLPDFNTIAFTKMEGDYLFKDGLMKLQKSVMLSNVADVDSSGSVNLVTDALNLKLNTTLKEGSGISMSTPVGMTVKGTFDDPKVKLDVKSVMEQPAVKKNLDKVKKGGEKFLKGLFK
ncbi:MAG: hypothetical protein A3J79_05755 [Elusimicrobia bacterium RIFOXYB2_FULL_62_6]|nr:MAG: hypothetical protein A3J79_05755 [Elusimicrobia bacterium RIFOXYB2_FULL_62_6]